MLLQLFGSSVALGGCSDCCWPRLPRIALGTRLAGSWPHKGTCGGRAVLAFLPAVLSRGLVSDMLPSVSCALGSLCLLRSWLSLRLPPPCPSCCFSRLSLWGLLLCSASSSLASSALSARSAMALPAPGGAPKASRVRTIGLPRARRRLFCRLASELGGASYSQHVARRSMYSSARWHRLGILGVTRADAVRFWKSLSLHGGLCCCSPANGSKAGGAFPVVTPSAPLRSRSFGGPPSPTPRLRPCRSRPAAPPASRHGAPASVHRASCFDVSARARLGAWPSRGISRLPSKNGGSDSLIPGRRSCGRCVHMSATATLALPTRRPPTRSPRAAPSAPRLRRSQLPHGSPARAGLDPQSLDCGNFARFRPPSMRVAAWSTEKVSTRHTSFEGTPRVGCLAYARLDLAVERRWQVDTCCKGRG